MGHQKNVIDAITDGLDTINSPYAEEQGKFLGMLLTNLERGAFCSALGVPDKTGTYLAPKDLAQWIAQVATEMSVSYIEGYLDEVAKVKLSDEEKRTSSHHPSNI